MGIGPTYAIPAVLKHVGLTKEDVDLFEVCPRPSILLNWTSDELPFTLI